MGDENLISAMADIWVDAGGDEDGISYCLDRLKQAVREEIARRSALQGGE